MGFDPKASTAVTATLPRHRHLGNRLALHRIPQHGLLVVVLLSAALSGLGALVLQPAFAQSALLESVKKNPQRAKDLCRELKELNTQGLSYTSPQAVAQIGSRQGLSPTDAEILSTYVVGLYCPDVR